MKREDICVGRFYLNKLHPAARYLGVRLNDRSVTLIVIAGEDSVGGEVCSPESNTPFWDSFYYDDDQD